MADGPAVLDGTDRRYWQVRTALALVFTAILFVMPVDAASAQGATPSDVRASLTADLTELTVGDIITFSLVIAHPSDHVVVVPRLEREWGSFEVREQTSVQTISTVDGVRTIAKQFRVTLFDTGSFETPALPITIRRPDGSVDEIEPVPVILTVRSVLVGAEDQLRDLRQPADLSTSLWDRPAVLIIIGLVALGLFGSVGYYLFGRSRTPKASGTGQVDTRSPLEIAMQELDHIGRLDLPGSGDFGEHYTLLSGVLRALLGTTFLSGYEAADTLDMSTEEIAMAVRHSSLDDCSARAIIGLLREADLVKFANCTPSSSRAYEATGKARSLVEAICQSFREGTTAEASAGIQGAP